MEDFSFPTIEQDHDSSQFCHLPFPHFTTSPLWFIPSVAPLEKSPHFLHRRSLSDPQKDSKKWKNVDQHIVDEEKMDMLWENFNEELFNGSNKYLSISQKNGQPLVRHRRPSLIFFIELLKKMFLIGKKSTNRTGFN